MFIESLISIKSLPDIKSLSDVKSLADIELLVNIELLFDIDLLLNIELLSLAFWVSVLLLFFAKTFKFILESVESLETINAISFAAIILPLDSIMPPLLFNVFNMLKYTPLFANM